jgi:hypothetical protein
VFAEKNDEELYMKWEVFGGYKPRNRAGFVKISAE